VLGDLECTLGGEGSKGIEVMVGYKTVLELPCEAPEGNGNDDVEDPARNGSESKISTPKDEVEPDERVDALLASVSCRRSWEPVDGPW